MRLNYTDKMTVMIQEDPMKGAAPQEAFVNAEGNILFQISRGFDDSIIIPARGRTVAEVKQDLKTELEKKYYKTATITLLSKSAAAKASTVYLLGEVQAHSVIIPPGETLTIFQAIVKAGPSEFANLKKIALSRVDPVSGERKIQSIDFDAIKRGRSKKEDDIELRDGDRIEVKAVTFKIF